jgi:hypothetical protein
VNRVALAELDGFAHDLLALLTTGTRVAGDSPQDSLGSGAHSQLAPTQRVGS